MLHMGDSRIHQELKNVCWINKGEQTVLRRLWKGIQNGEDFIIGWPILVDMSVDDDDVANYVEFGSVRDYGNHIEHQELNGKIT